MKAPSPLLVFGGDGRRLAHPPAGAIGARPIPVRKGTARTLAKSFYENGYSNHSPAGSTVWVILKYCEHYRIPYTLEFYPKLGYRVTRIQRITEREFYALGGFARAGLFRRHNGQSWEYYIDREVFQ